MLALSDLPYQSEEDDRGDPSGHTSSHAGRRSGEFIGLRSPGKNVNVPSVRFHPREDGHHADGLQAQAVGRLLLV